MAPFIDYPISRIVRQPEGLAGIDIVNIIIVKKINRPESVIIIAGNVQYKNKIALYGKRFYFRPCIRIEFADEKTVRRI